MSITDVYYWNMNKGTVTEWLSVTWAKVIGKRGPEDVDWDITTFQGMAAHPLLPLLLFRSRGWTLFLTSHGRAGHKEFQEEETENMNLWFKNELEVL